MWRIFEALVKMEEKTFFQCFHTMGFTRGSRLQGLRFNPCDPQFQAIGRTNLILPVEVIPAPNV